jgi:hypothetical protein
MRSNFLPAARIRRGAEAHLPTEEPDNPHRPPPPPVPDAEPPPVPEGDPPPEAPPERLCQGSRTAVTRQRSPGGL